MPARYSACVTSVWPIQKSCVNVTVCTGASSASPVVLPIENDPAVIATIVEP